MIFEDEDDILEERRGNTYCVLCRSKKYVQFGFPKREPVLPMDGMFDRYLVILFNRMRLKDEADVSGEWAWRKLCRRLA